MCERLRRELCEALVAKILYSSQSYNFLLFMLKGPAALARVRA